MDTIPTMINGSHVIIYADDPEQARGFFRDVLEFPNVDVHDGWLIFRLPPAELGIHPTGSPGLGEERHEVYLMCDDIHATVAELTEKGVEFTATVEDRGFGLVTTLRVPGSGELGLYEPKHQTGYDLLGQRSDEGPTCAPPVSAARRARSGV
jgi:catechol 2,3-dioxygenase-like lactoylglutathione lyase family enzyme